MLRLRLLLTIVVTALFTGFVFDVSAQDDRPNIVLIIADDMSWDDCSPYGHKTIPTPNLERLAREGMRFDKGFVTTSSCSPSRASIITGQYPTTTDADELHWALPKEKITFVEKLKATGYWAGAAGKWHLGTAMKGRFDKVISVEGSSDTKSGCEDWLNLFDARAKDKPFFLWLASLDAHRPYQKGADGVSAEDVKVAPYHPDTPKVRADYQLYYDEITRLDRHVGLVLAKLKDIGQDDNTLVLFLSDNGRPFPRDKTTLYDSGIRSPFIARWPDVIEPESVCKEIVSSVDIARTFLGIAKIDKISPNFKGRSFLPQMIDPSKPGREYIFAEKNWHDFEDHSRAVRNKRYKYIRNYYEDLPLTPPSDAILSPTYEEMKRLGRSRELLPHQLSCFIQPRAKEELYDTEVDPHEMNNVAGDPRYASVVLAMRAALKSWEKTHKDAPPTLRTADEFDRITGLPTQKRISPRRSKAEMVEKKLTAP